MVHGATKRLILAAALLTAAAGLAACESAAEREARLAREAYIKSLNIEELQNSLTTVNPERYSPAKPGYNRGRGRDKTR